MLVALGFALALVIVLLVARGLWSMAMRIGARRHSKQIPVAMLELQADRDRLRAEHAMMSRKLELRLEDIKIRMTEQMAEVSRHRNRVQSMMAEMDRRDDSIKNRDREVGALNAQLEVHKADLAACADAIDRYANEAAQKDTELTRQAALIAQLSTNLRDKGQLVSTLGSELQTALNLNVGKPNSAKKKVDATENRLLKRVAELTSISSQMSNQRDGNPMVSLQQETNPAISNGVETPSRQAKLDQQLAETELEATAMTEEIRALDTMMTAKAAPEIQAAPAPQPKKSGAMANVISLAQRIRALQKGAQ